MERTTSIGDTTVTTTASRAFTRCPCGHLFLHHDINDCDGDGSDLCCVEGCDQRACPGRNPVSTSGNAAPEPASNNQRSAS